MRIKSHVCNGRDCWRYDNRDMPLDAVVSGEGRIHTHVIYLPDVGEGLYVPTESESQLKAHERRESAEQADQAQKEEHAAKSKQLENQWTYKET